jgi:hypothetical protein
LPRNQESEHEPLVLVVDDEPDVEVLFRQRFRRDWRDLRAGRFTMEFAQSGPVALQRIRDTAGVSLILTLSDINMPGMSGLELLPQAATGCTGDHDHRLGYRDYLGALQRFRAEDPCEVELLTMSSYLIDYPFAGRLFPSTLAVLKRLEGFGLTVILTCSSWAASPTRPAAQAEQSP